MVVTKTDFIEQTKQPGTEAGRKLGFLLAKSALPAEQKESWLALLPTMTLDQIERFTRVLEASYLQAQTADIDDKLAGQATEIYTRHARAMAELEAEAATTAKEIDDILTAAGN